jgi:hypothetical protein
MFKVTLGLAIFHNHRLDSDYDGRYVVRLPDNRQVYAENYAVELAKLKENQHDEERQRTQCGLSCQSQHT